jgi:hypothetical protein
MTKRQKQGHLLMAMISDDLTEAQLDRVIKALYAEAD